MAGGNGRRGRDRVLESRHLVGVFLGVVLLCGVFFTLGYVMGKTQYGGTIHVWDASARAAPPSPASVKPPEKTAPVAPPSTEWDFLSKKKDARLEPSAKPSGNSGSVVPAVKTTGRAAAPEAAPKTVAATSRPASRFPPPRMSKGAIVLQIAALSRESDAFALADALQQKRYPSFVLTPAADKFYRVQVGPYADLGSAEMAKKLLERDGFKVIIKR